jgi:hypothetical protein
MRVRGEVASLRRGRIARIIRAALRAGGHRATFRVVEFNVLHKQLHLIVEADDAMCLARGIQGLAVRFARRINRAFNRKGRFFADRYHARTLRTSREVRDAIHGVLRRGHRCDSTSRGTTPVDMFSSALWFTGWARPVRMCATSIYLLQRVPRPTAFPTVWLLRVAWKKHGLLRLEDALVG